MGNLISNKTYDYNGLDKNEIIKKFGIQNVYTPIDKIEEIIGCSFIDFINEDMKKIGILYNTEFLEKFIKSDYIKNNEVEITFCYDSEFDKRIAEKLMRFYKYDKTELISIIDAEKENDWNKIMAGKKFDVVFSNPPYNNNLDLKILKCLFKISENIVFVHPSTFLIDSRNVEQIYKEIKNSGFLQKASLFWANTLFHIKLFCPCVVSVWNTTKYTEYSEIIDTAYKNWFYNGKIKTYKCKTSNMCLHGSMAENLLSLKTILNTFISNNNTLFYKRSISFIGDYNVVFPRIRGGSDILKKDGENTCEHFFSFFGYQNKDYVKDSSFKFLENTPDNEKLIWSFKTKKERDNFVIYCKSKISRFFLSLIKKNGNLHRGELKGIPWLDFTQEWNDAKLCKEFEISEELWNYIDNFIPDYYDDYKSGFEKEDK